jgi:putative multicomponent Na+:H+ antiporter subunit B
MMFGSIMGNFMMDNLVTGSLESLLATDFYLYGIVALLPLSACLVVTQANPYHALIMRGILGAMAALVYAVLGAPDVALTEALMGTLLAITLYAITVRSSLVMRLGILEDQAIASPLTDEIRTALRAHHVRLELVHYPDLDALGNALANKEIHGSCVTRSPSKTYETTIRLQRLYDILNTKILQEQTSLIFNQ